MNRALFISLIIFGACGGSDGAPISGELYRDVDGNGQLDNGEPGIEGVTVYADIDGNGVYNEGEPSDVTDENGTFGFDPTAFGDGPFSIRQVIPLQHTNTQAAVASVASANEQSIIGGSPANITNYPFMGSSQAFGQHTCGSALVSSTWVITAAHCVETEIGGFPPTTIRFGSELAASGGVAATVKQVIKHPQWNVSSGISHDIAMIELNEPQLISRPLLMTDELVEEGIGDIGDEVISIGWGVTESGQGSANLLEVDLDILNGSSCPITPSTGFICAGDLTPGVHKTSCNGDSGGPLIQKLGDDWVHLGAVSHGQQQGCPANSGGAYTDTRHYLDFIRTYVVPEESPAVQANLGDYVVFGNFR